MSINPIEIKGITPLNEDIIVVDMAFNERYTSSGIYIPSDDKKVQGVHPRWARVYAIGPKQIDVQVGQWICVEHGRWTRGIKVSTPNDKEITIRKVDPKDVMLVSDEPILDEILGRPL